MIKSVIFDLDGTLVDSIQDLADSVNFALAQQNFELLNLEEIRQRIGYGIDNLVISSLPTKYQTNKKIIVRSLELMAQHYSTAWKKNTALYPNIPFLLDQLMIKNIPIAIISNKPEAFLQEMVNFLMPKWDFIAIAGGKPSVPLKPNPQSTLQIIKEFHLNPLNTAFIGDGETDIKTALAAGIQPIAVTWGFRNVEELKKVGADICIDNPLDLLTLL
ncbi:MAG: HAD family hydrolase [Brevinema sp.]